MEKVIFIMGRNIPIKVARAELDMTQTELAKAVGVSRQTINSIEQGTAVHDRIRNLPVGRSGVLPGPPE